MQALRRPLKVKQGCIDVNGHYLSLSVFLVNYICLWLIRSTCGWHFYFEPIGTGGLSLSKIATKCLSALTAMS